jgi:glycogen debranching enzyme
MPGYFELPLKKGESVIFSAGTAETEPSALKRKFNGEIAKRIPRNTFHNCLLNSAQQFFVRKEKKTEIMAGYPWYGRRTRDTFASLPGLALASGDLKTFKSVLDSSLAGLLKSLTSGDQSDRKTMGADEPLWFFWALQQYTHQLGDRGLVWKSYGKKIKFILDRLREGVDDIVILHDNGLLFCPEKTFPGPGWTA